MRVANLENENRKIVSTMGNFHVLEYAKDASVSPANAAAEYFMGKMGVRRRQVVIDMNGKDTAIEVRLFPWEELDMVDTLRAKLFTQQGK